MKKLNTFLAISIFMMTSQVFAKDIVVFSSKSCHKVNSNKSFILFLKRGEKLPDSILKCVEDANIKSASLSGLGLLEDPTIAYYDLHSKKFKENPLNGLFELTSLNGNVTQLNGKPTAHIHLNLADKNNNVLGGHFVKGEVGVVAEITIVPLSGTIEKQLDKNFNLNVMMTEGETVK